MVALLFPTSLQARTACKTKRCNERVAAKRCSQTRPKWCVERSILRWRLTGWESAWMRRIPACESRWNPRAISPGGHMGLYQFASGTWRSTPYGERDPFRAKWNALAAGWMVVKGRAPGEWACK